MGKIRRGGRSPRRAPASKHQNKVKIENRDGGVHGQLLQGLRSRLSDHRVTFTTAVKNMASTLALQLFVGSVFGAALLASGVANPQTITDQFALRNFHMLVAFLTASALSALAIYVTNVSGYAKLAPRTRSDYGWLGTYGGNIIGGAMQGIGMAVSGACPGTVLVQTALGYGQGIWVMLGSVLGGALFIMFGEKLRFNRTSDKSGRGHEVTTFQDKLGLSTLSMVVLYEVMMGIVVTLSVLFGPLGAPGREAVTGGAMIGAAQLSSILVLRKTLGISTAYQDLAGHVLGLLKGTKTRPGWTSIIFAAGAMAGAKATSQFVSTAVQTSRSTQITPAAAVLGGVVSIFGARLAGGCTSGHGISGCSTLSISSLITVASIFGGGIAFTMLFM